jgi:hypothetical protein
MGRPWLLETLVDAMRFPGIYLYPLVRRAQQRPCGEIR